MPLKIKKSNNSFIHKIFLTALFPNIVAVLGGTINVFFDGIMVGQRLGETALSAVNQSLPICLLLCTIGSLFASGASVVASIALGSGKKEESDRIFHATLLVPALVSVAVSIIGLLLSNGIAEILSTSETYAYVLTYIRITLIGSIFKILIYVPFFFLKIEGRNGHVAFSMLLMTAINIVLDAVFLFVFDFGVAGAAWASVIATAIACILSFVFMFHKNSEFSFGLAFYKKEDWGQIIRFGSPMAFNNILSSARIFVLNMILKSLGGSELLSVFAVVNNISEFSVCIQNGVPQTGTAMTGIFVGEKDSNSVKVLLNTELFSGSVLSLVFSVLVAVFSGSIGRLFGCTVDCQPALICFSASLVLATFNNVLSYYFNIIGEVILADIIIFCRGFAFITLFCFLLRGCGENIWLFYPCAELMTLIVAVLISIVLSQKREITRFYLLDESFEKSGQTISFSVECDEKQICNASERVNDFCIKNGFSSKKAMAISLSIEEILNIISQKSLMGNGTMSVRVLKSGDNGIVRIRSGGRRYNPIEEQDASMDYVGVRMITKMAVKTEYLSALGVNTLIIYL